MTDKRTARELAEWLRAWTGEDVADPEFDTETHRQLLAAAAELDRLADQTAEDAEHIDSIRPTLQGVARALKGDPGPLRDWSWHDLPDLARTAVEERDRLREALRPVRAIRKYLTLTVCPPELPPLIRALLMELCDKCEAAEAREKAGGKE